MSAAAPTPVVTPAVPSAAAQRSMLIDVVKGAAILLVAFSHTMQGLEHRYGSMANWAPRLDGFIYAFHMPAFFFVSGIFLLSSLRKRGLKRFTVSKLETVMYPSWLWGALVLPWMPVLLGHLMNQKRAPLHAILFNPISGNLEWFLPSLFLAIMVAALLHRVPTAVLFGLSWLVSIYWRPIDVAILDRGLTMLPFLIAGMWIGPRVSLLVEKLSRWECAVLAIVSFVPVWLATPWGVGPPFWGFVPVGLLGTAGLLFLGRLLGLGSGARFFAWMGMASLGIYLFAPFGQGAARAALEHVGIRSVPLHLALGTALATLPTAWVYQHRERLRLGWVFAWPF